MLSFLRSRRAAASLVTHGIARHAAILALATCLVCASSPRSLQAQTDGNETEVARQRFREGVAQYDRQDYEKARLAFLQAYLLKPHPAVLLNLAQSELRAGRHADAATNFAKYLRENPSAPATEHARAGFEEARVRVTELNIQVNAPGAEISVDGNDSGRSPLTAPLYLMPGRHNVLARKGNASAGKVLDAIAGRREYITLELQEGYATQPAAAPSAAGADGVVAGVATGPAGTVPGADTGGHGQGFFDWVGSSPASVATVTVAALALGTSAVLAGFASNRYAAANDARSQIMAALQGHVDRNVVAVDTVPCGASGIANGVVQFGAGVTDNDQRTLITQYANACDLFTERSDSGDRLKTLSLVSLGVGAFAAIGTVVWYFSDSSGGGSASADDTNPLHSASLVPLLTPDTQGLQLQMSF